MPRFGPPRTLRGLRDRDRDDRRPHGDGGPLVTSQSGDGALPRGRDLHEGLRCLDLGEWLVDDHGVADVDEPPDDLAVGKALAEVG
jgi:hypothetical protein